MDFNILNLIQANLKNPFFDFLMPILSYIGTAGIVWIAISIVMICFKQSRTYGILALISVTLVFITGELILKNIVCRVRPCNIAGINIDMLVPKPNSYSFPSGHSSSSFAAATIIFIWDKRFGIPAIILAAGIAFSRMYLYVHFTTDVLVGMVLGIVGALLTYYIYKKLFFKKGGRLNEKT